MDRFIPKGGAYMRGGGLDFDVELRHSSNKSRASGTGDPPPEGSKKTFILEERTWAPLRGAEHLLRIAGEDLPGYT